MSNAKPYTVERLNTELDEWEQGGKPRFNSVDLLETVRALEAARAANTLLAKAHMEAQAEVEARWTTAEMVGAMGSIGQLAPHQAAAILSRIKAARAK